MPPTGLIWCHHSYFLHPHEQDHLTRIRAHKVWPSFCFHLWRLPTHHISLNVESLLSVRTGFTILHAELGHEPQSLIELEPLCCRASAQENKAATKFPGQELIYDVWWCFSCCTGRAEENNIKVTESKTIQIYSETSSAGTSWAEKWSDWTYFDQFKDLDRLTRHARAPVHPCSTTKDDECHGPHEFAILLETIFASEHGFESPRLKTLVRARKATSFRDIQQFTLVELQDALKHLRRNKCIHSNGIVAECFVYGSLEWHERI